VVELMSRKEHLNPEGLQQIVGIKSSMNNELSAVLKSAFPNIIPVSRPKVQIPKNLDGHWLAGCSQRVLVVFMFKKLNLQVTKMVLDSD